MSFRHFDFCALPRFLAQKVQLDHNYNYLDHNTHLATTYSRHLANRITISDLASTPLLPKPTQQTPAMSSFFSSGNAQTASDMQTKKEEVKQRITQELAVANAQTLINVSLLLVFRSWHARH